MLKNSAHQAGSAQSIDIAKGNLYVTASGSTGSSYLKLISWSVAPDGTVTRRGDSGEQAREATNIRIVTVSGELFVTATRTAESKLKVVPWRVRSTGIIQRLADASPRRRRSVSSTSRCKARVLAVAGWSPSPG